jgi:ABC-2 type transport system permease protein
MRRLLAVIRKEFWHVLRDPYALVGATLGTVFLMALLSYAISADIEQIPIAIVDGDRSPTSRAYLQQFDVDAFFAIEQRLSSADEARQAVTSGQARGAIIVPPGFAKGILEGEIVAVQIIVDGTDPTIARKFQSNAERLSSAVSVRLREETVARGAASRNGSAFAFRTRPLYNGELRELNTILPGLMAFVLTFPPLFAILSLVREKEQGSMEQLMTTPIRRHQLLIGKTVPYLLIGLLDVLLLALIGVVLFEVPFRGRWIDLLVLSSVFLIANLGISMLLSSVLRNQMAALIVGSLLFIFPITQSGLTTPLFVMPRDARIRALVWPATHYIIITRGIFLKGLGLHDLINHGLYLLIAGVVLNGLTLWRLEKKLT